MGAATKAEAAMRRFTTIRTTIAIGLMALVGLVTTAGLSVLANPAAAQETDEGTLVVSVTSASQPVERVLGDLFEANADGSRGAWLEGRRTEADGSFELPVKAGCYVLVLVAPPRESFQRIHDRPVDNGSRFAEAPVCIAAGLRTEISAELTSAGESTIVGTVVNEGGDPVAGAFADFFTDVGGGQRGEWLGSETTDQAGSYGRGVTSGCYVVVLVAPDDASFTSSGNRFREVPGCVETGAELRVDGTISGTTPAPGTIGGSVVDANGAGLIGVVADYFEANADGSRGTWLGDVTTNDGGSYTRPVDAGCYIIVLIAPRGVTFTPDGGQYRTLPACVASGETVVLPTAQVGGICPSPQPVNVDANTFGFLKPRSIVTGSDGKIYLAGDDGTTVTDIWVYDPETGDGRNLGIPVGRGPIAGDGFLYFSDLSGVDPPEIRSYNQATGEVTTIAQLSSRFAEGPMLFGNRLLWQDGDVISVYDTVTGEVTTRNEGNFSLQDSPVMGPDGRVYYRRLLADGRTDTVIGSIDLETGATSILDLADGAGYGPNQLTFGPQGRLYYSAKLPLFNGEPDQTFRFVSTDPVTEETRVFFEFEDPRLLVAADDGRVYYRSTRRGNEFLFGIKLNGGILGQPISVEPGVEPFGTGLDGRLYFASVQDPTSDTRLRAREIEPSLTSETTVFDGATFVDELHFSPDGTIYFHGFDGTETDLFAYQPLCSP